MSLPLWVYDRCRAVKDRFTGKIDNGHSCPKRENTENAKLYKARNIPNNKSNCTDPKDERRSMLIVHIKGCLTRV